jgi:hypothetical protein
LLLPPSIIEAIGNVVGCPPIAFAASCGWAMAKYG